VSNSSREERRSLGGTLLSPVTQYASAEAIRLYLPCVKTLVIKTTGQICSRGNM